MQNNVDNLDNTYIVVKGQSSTVCYIM